tara:strand:+ start:172 stop:606 length:435 start_codon:yes stop_codon:yes gene_type:complete
MHPTRIFKTSDELEIVWKQYKTDLSLQAKEWQKVQYVGKEGQRMSDDLKLPYTLEGFEVFCYQHYGCVEQYFRNKDGYYDEFVAVCSYIRKEIRHNQILGGMMGVFNPSITQRLNSLVEKTEDVTPPAPKKLIIKIRKSKDETN